MILSTTPTSTTSFAMFYWTCVLASETYSSSNFILYNIANSILCIPIPTKVFYCLV